MLQFRNNAGAATAAILPADSGDPSYGTITVVADGSEASFGSTYPQLATVAHATMPGQYEIVRLLSRSSAVFTCERGVDDTNPLEWPVGATLEARVTAGMLDLFPQIDGGFMDAKHGAKFAIAGTPALMRSATQMLASATDFHRNGFGVAIAGVSPYVDLGVPPTWASGNYYHGDVVAPTTPDGAQYWHCTNQDMAVFVSTEPAFAGPGTNVPIDAADLSLGYMVAMAVPLDFIVRFDSVQLVIEEVGFIARAVTAGDVPSVSIGSDLDAGAPNPTRYANNVALSQITGDNCVHRIPVAAGGQLIDTLKFKVETAATGGKFAGRFYWRGFFVEPG